MKPAFWSWMPCLTALNDSFVTKVKSFEHILRKNSSILPPMIAESDFVLPMTVNESIAVAPFAGTKLLFPSLHVREILDDKNHFTRFMLKHFPEMIPKIFYLEGRMILNPRNISYQGSFVSKPPVSFAGKGIKIHPNEKFEKIHSSQRSLVMEFLNTTVEYGYHFIAIHGKVVSSLLYEQSMNFSDINRGPMRKSFDLLAEPYPIDLSSFWQLLHKLKYHGAGQTCFRFAEYDGKPKFFEINSRFGGTSFQQRCDVYSLFCF